ncbi:YrhB domain-containing protein [Aulosira sp. FACHB-615]|uniref:YrhB domain-containing protein n=1 Tax=Aulosira sp. FACHB-615 TaxID=2692777 RepID=UPI0016850D45|nr:YrhB domain-containing protein [Aulosira sp. FACHB-615]MBD2491579.1 hypothetical protein [Aulosira sp. FACHB-615]
MIDKETAASIVKEYITREIPVSDDELVIIHERTIEKQWGWVFFYQGKRWVETNDRRYKILGLYPIVIEKEDGTLNYLTLLKTIEESIQAYEEKRKLTS